MESILGVLKKYPNIEKCVVYGSRAIGNFRNGSDIDLTLFGETLTLTELLKIENELDDLLLPYIIDLSIFHQINHEGLVEHIKTNGKVFFERKLKYT
ncbi:nucleotidyltransferase domain-containing protein [Aquiflexum sp.]|uniref:nucleotidyltransferase domain-containing protein n=1 Tax=Aquiflexum sp. TaxID=1872584 RepID=UPI0035945346